VVEEPASASGQQYDNAYNEFICHYSALWSLELKGNTASQEELVTAIIKCVPENYLTISQFFRENKWFIPLYLSSHSAKNKM
jgi:hypothetical protein